MMRSGSTCIALAAAVFCTLLLSPAPALSSRHPVLRGEPGVMTTGRPILFAVTRPLRDIAAEEWARLRSGARTGPSELERPNGWRHLKPRDPVQANKNNHDGALQTAFREPTALDPPLVSFEGCSNEDNFAAYGSRVSPPDTCGDVGPNHFVQQVNLLARVFSKTGTPLSPPFKLSSLFAALGGPCATRNDGDPIVLYDPLADRWVLSQFCIASGSINTPPFIECIAVSRTADPLGQYYAYGFITPGDRFPDYPKLGVWPDGYYMGVNQFQNSQYAEAGVFAFDRERMLRGDPSAGFIYFDMAQIPGDDFTPLPADVDGLVPPAPGQPCPFVELQYQTSGFTVSGRYRVFDFHADFNNPAASTFAERAESPVVAADWNTQEPFDRRPIEQPSPASVPTNNLDALSGRLMHRLQYRSFGPGGGESLALNHSVQVSQDPAAKRMGVRYCQLMRSSPGSVWQAVEQATLAPAGDSHSRWTGSTAVDWQGNLAVGYSVSSRTVFPHIRFAARLAGDPPNGLAQGEQVLIDGTGVQRTTSNRWGDYSALCVDPADDSTFWFTSEYYTLAGQQASTAGWQTRIGAFRLPGALPAPRGSVDGLVTDITTGQPVPGAVVETLGIQRSAGANGSYSLPLSPGTYDLTASAPGYLPNSASGVPVVDDQSTTRNFALTRVPVVIAGTATLDQESCTPGNGVLDPGELVTVSFTLTNTGPFAGSNLVARLLNGNGVVPRSGPQSYGNLAGSGGTATRQFTFNVSEQTACGGTVLPVLELENAGAVVGAVTFLMAVGSPNVVLQEAFDGVTAPALPSGWTSEVVGPIQPWSASTSTPASVPNCALATVSASVSETRLTSPGILIPSASGELRFRQLFLLHGLRDGGVLEVSEDGLAFVDAMTAGCTFATGGYTGVLTTGTGNPLAGRAAWTGNGGVYTDVVARLPAAFSGKTIFFRWRLGCETGGSAGSWRIDDVRVYGGYNCCTQACELICPPDVTVDAAPNQCGALVTYPEPQTTGLCGSVSCSPPSGSFFSVGTTVVTCTAAAGNTCTFRVTVRDAQAPGISCPTNVIATQTDVHGAVASYPSPVIGDNCPGAGVACVPPSGSVFPVGTTPVTCTAQDASGNTTQCVFDVTVVPPASNGKSVVGSGTLSRPKKATFKAEITRKRGVLGGSLRYKDPVLGRTLRSTRITALVIPSARQAMIYGVGTINGAGTFNFIANARRKGSKSSFGITIENGDTAVLQKTTGEGITIKR